MARPSIFTQELADLICERIAEVQLYVLRCPVSGEIRYAGKANDAEKRLKSHMRDARRRNTPVYCWIRSLQAKGLVPVIEVVETASPDGWQIAEARLIARLRRNGVRLLNLADGGDQPSQTVEQRADAGRAAAKARVKTARDAKVYRLKRDMGAFLKWAKQSGRHEAYERICAKLKFAASIDPRNFGGYASL